MVVGDAGAVVASCELTRTDSGASTESQRDEGRTEDCSDLFTIGVQIARILAPERDWV